MSDIYLTGAVTDFDDPFQWHDELQESDEYGHNFINPYTLNEFGLGDDEIYEQPEKVVEPALSAVQSADGLLVHWDDDAFLVGSTMELHHAHANDVPVVLWYDGYKDADRLSPWLLHLVEGVYEDKDTALNVLLGEIGPKFDLG